jgi:sugar phosphate permease
MAAGRARYIVLVLTFVTAMIMYIDRVCMGVAAPAIAADLGFDKITLGYVFSAFSLGYALFQIPGGWSADRFGPRIVLTASMAWWSAFTAATAAASGVASMASYRFLFGVGEAAAFPAASRALVPWLPFERRAFGQGFQHAGSRFGAAVTPPLVVTLIAGLGWRGTFCVLGAFGVVWAAVWYAYYRNLPEEHRGVNAEELELLQRAPRPRPGKRHRTDWAAILGNRSVWALSATYFCYGWVLWMYLSWLPTYLVEERGFTMLEMGVAASVPLLAATAANALGGWISDALAVRWGDLRRGRVSVSVAGFLIAGAGLAPGALALDATVALVCLTLALAGLELTVAVSWAICIDIGGEHSGTVSAIMNTSGNLAGALSAVVVGFLSSWYGWTAPLLLAAFLCLTAAFLIQGVRAGSQAKPKGAAVEAV